MDLMFLYHVISSTVLPTLPAGAAARGRGYTGVVCYAVLTFTSGLANFLVRVDMAVRL